jgi:hypothetical protein
MTDFHADIVTVGTRIFQMVERYAERERIPPELVEHAIGYALAAWAATLTLCDAPDDGTLDDRINADLEYVDLTVRRLIVDRFADRVSPAFHADVEARTHRVKAARGLPTPAGSA